MLSRYRPVLTRATICARHHFDQSLNGTTALLLLTSHTELIRTADGICNFPIPCDSAPPIGLLCGASQSVHLLSAALAREHPGQHAAAKRRSWSRRMSMCRLSKSACQKPPVADSSHSGPATTPPRDGGQASHAPSARGSFGVDQGFWNGDRQGFRVIGVADEGKDKRDCTEGHASTQQTTPMRGARDE